jgi:hypothetical protein
MRAWTRDTLGSASRTALPAARPIDTSPTSATRVWSGRTISSTSADGIIPTARRRSALAITRAFRAPR